MSLMPLGVHNRLSLPVDRSGLRLAGRPIRDWGLWLLLGGVEIDAPDKTTDFVNVPGMSGSVNRTLLDESGHAYADRRTITMHVATLGNLQDAIETKQAVGALDGIDTTLEWGGLPGHYQGFLTVGAWTDTWGSGGVYRHSTCDLTMLADPDLVDEPRTFDLTVGDPRHVWVKGNRPSRPVITATPPRDTKRLYITVGARQLVYDLPGTDGAKTLVADCENRSTTYGDAVVFPSVDSDYPVLTPGEVPSQLSAGTGSVTYHPRWRI